MRTILAALFIDERGATIVEYALILSLVAVAAATAVTLLGAKTGTTLSNAAAKMK